MINKAMIIDFCNQKPALSTSKKIFFDEVLSLEQALLYLTTIDDKAVDYETVKIIFERRDFLSDSENICFFLETIGEQLHLHEFRGVEILDCLMEVQGIRENLEKMKARRLFKIAIATDGNCELFDFLTDDAGKVAKLIKDELNFDEILSKNTEWNRGFVSENLAKRKDVQNYLLSKPIHESFKFCFAGKQRHAGVPFIEILLQRSDLENYLTTLNLTEAMEWFNKEGFTSEFQPFIKLLVKRQDVQDCLRGLPSQETKWMLSMGGFEFAREFIRKG